MVQLRWNVLYGSNCCIWINWYKGEIPKKEEAIILIINHPLIWVIQGKLFRAHLRKQVIWSVSKLKLPHINTFSSTIRVKLQEGLKLPVTRLNCLTACSGSQQRKHQSSALRRDVTYFRGMMGYSFKWLINLTILISVELIITRSLWSSSLLVSCAAMLCDRTANQ